MNMPYKKNTDAEAVSYLEITNNKIFCWGCGLSKSITTASIKSLFSAINRLLSFQMIHNKKTLFELIHKHSYQYRKESFTLSSGKTSKYYFDCKKITMHPERLLILTKYLVFYHIPKNLGTQIESIGGLTMGADAICYSIALEYQKMGKKIFPLVVRKNIKQHGTQSLVEGLTENIKECLIVDDVITTGTSTLKAIESIRKLNIKVKKGFCIIDREEEGLENITKANVQIFPIFKKSDF